MEKIRQHHAAKNGKNPAAPRRAIQLRRGAGPAGPARCWPGRFPRPGRYRARFAHRYFDHYQNSRCLTIMLAGPVSPARPVSRAIRGRHRAAAGVAPRPGTGSIILRSDLSRSPAPGRAATGARRGGLGTGTGPSALLTTI